MADKKISQLTALSAANLAPSTDVLAIVDTSATETKKIVAQDLINGVLNVASAVGIGTASPGYKVTAVVAAGSDAFFADGNAQSYSGYRIRAGASGQQWAFRGGNTSMALTDVTASLDRVIVDTSGNLGIGTSSPAALASGNITLDITATTSRSANIWLHANNTSGTSAGFQIQSGSDSTAYLWNYANTAMIFANNNAERGRFTSGGYFKASNNGTYLNSTASYHEINNDGDISVLVTRSTSTGSGVIVYNAQLPTSAAGLFFIGETGGVAKIRIEADGDVYNTNGTYGIISDARLKQDIVDAGSQWDDLKAIRFRKYRMKSDVEADPNAPALFGVVAQELEQVCPGLVDDGEIKTVKSSILLMKAAKALQEAMARIESLEAKVAALEAK